MHARDTADVAAAFRVDPRRGLAAGEVLRRSIHFGRNIVHAGAWPHRIAARVLCEGEEKSVPATDLVPGDVIIVEPGGEIPADARIVAADRLIVDESALTGAGSPVVKSPDVVADASPLADRHSMLYLGTRVIEGHATAIVTATGDATELGKIRKTT